MSEIPVEIAFGCRDVEEGTWTGAAFVYHKYVNSDTGMSVIYDNGREQLNDVASYKDGSTTYYMYLKQGWETMSSEDIEKTTGLVVNPNTLRFPLPPPVPVNDDGKNLAVKTEYVDPEISPVVTPKPNIYAAVLDTICENQSLQRKFAGKPPPFLVHIVFGLFVAGLVYISRW